MKLYYISGQIMGQCVYIEDVESPRENTRRYARFECRCGNHFVSQIDSVKREATKSCGCLNDLQRRVKGRKLTHGMTGKPVYMAWSRMKSRCTNKNSPDYPEYGGRGIKVCDTWLVSFERFYSDIGHLRQDGLELDRIDVNGDYRPENCRWVTEQTQSWNQRIYKSNSTGCAGVTRSSKNKNKFEVRISKAGKEFHLGTFDNLDNAINIRKEAEITFYGETLDVKRK